MTSKKTTRRALFSSVISLILCCAMLIGTTFAWFTDSVTSSGNIIKSGKLDVEMHYTENLESEWKDASDGAIFNYQFWEPGYSDAKYVKIENVGNLAFKYQMNIIPDVVTPEGEANLADVIDVYFGIVGEGFTVPTEFSTDMTGLMNVGTLSELMADPDGIAYGALLPAGENLPEGEVPAELEKLVEEGSVTACIILHMQEEAGNEYQELSVGEGFFVQLLATQFTYEEDSFGNDYDKDATYEELGTNNVKTAAEFVNALTNLKSGETVKLMNDIELGDADIVLQDWTVTGTTEENGATVNVVEYANKVCNIDLNGYKLSATDHAIELHGGTLNIKNGTISMDSETQDGTFITVGGHSPVYDSHKVAKCGQAAYNPASVLNLENVTFEGSSAVDGGFATSGHAIYVTCHGQVHIRNCTFDLVMENGVYANPFDVYNNASDGIGDGSGSATVVYVYEGTKFYGDPTYQAWKDAVNTDWEVNGGIRVYIADGYKLEAAPIADGDTYAWYTVVAE